MLSEAFKSEIFKSIPGNILWYNLYCSLLLRPKRCPPDLSEFLEPDDDNVVSRQFIQGHNRLYYHSNSVIPLLPNEIEEDSEDEIDPEWLRQKTVNVCISSHMNFLPEMWN